MHTKGLEGIPNGQITAGTTENTPCSDLRPPELVYLVKSVLYCV